MSENQAVRVEAADRPATLAEAKWEQRAEELSFGALESVRGTAAKWAGTIATLLSIFGVVTLVRFVGSEVRRAHRTEATSAAMWLSISWMLALGAIASLAVAVGIVWLKTPDEAVAPAKTIVVTSEGVHVCGKLLPGTGDDTIVILEKSSDDGTSIPASDITALGTLAACPGD